MRFFKDESLDGKRIHIFGPIDIDIDIDNDDVDREQVARDTDKLLDLLDKHWVG